MNHTNTPNTERAANTATRTKILGASFLCLGQVFLGLQLAGHRLSASTASNGVSVGLTIVSADANIQANLLAKPEKRIPSTGNDSTRLTIEVRNEGSTSPLFSETVTTSSGGTYTGIVLSGLSAGTYDITAKGYSHLRTKLASFSISSGSTVDFTDSGNDPLLSGDVNSSSGDNVINGIDLTIIINDLTGSTERYDLNRDGLVNGIDLTNAITNLTQTGDS